MEKDIKAGTGREVFIRQVFNAPPELVYKAWTTPEYLERWYAPDNCTLEYKLLDIREGGDFHLCIHNPEFGDCWCTGTYLELVPNEKIVYRISNADENAQPIDPASIGMDPEWPGTTLVTVTFKDLGGQTELTLSQTVPEIVAIRTGAQPSWLKQLQNLDTLLTAI